MHIHNGPMCLEIVRKHDFLLIENIISYLPKSVDIFCLHFTRCFRGFRKEPERVRDHRLFIIQSSVTVSYTS